ncbi:MAG: diguanylate cyclase, partial [Wenzhouxiangellaceae bacterium]|nr:diguanylate cyclase [Wenzhouxiangellaceae bacterium]
DHRQLGAILVFRDVTQMRSLASQLSYQARHDELTGLLNRREFEARVTRALEDARRHGRESWLCFIDMDQFKVINDTCGHATGDDVLKQLGEVLRAGARAHDLPARHGGDEVALLMPETKLDAYLATVTPQALTSLTVTDPDALRATVAETRARGYATAVDQLDYGITALAVP